MSVPQYVLKVYQNSRESRYAFAFYNGFCKVCEKNNVSPKPPKMKSLKAHISLFHKAILLKFGMWGAEGRGHLQFKNDSDSRREHGAAYV